MYGDKTIGISLDYDGKILNINRIKIDHQHPYQYKITLHELLHAIGYKRHSINPYSIMFLSITPDQELTTGDIQIIKMLYDPRLNLKDGMTYDEVYKILHGEKEFFKQDIDLGKKEISLKNQGNKATEFGTNNGCKIEDIATDGKEYFVFVDGRMYRFNDSICGGKIIRGYHPKDKGVSQDSREKVTGYRIKIKFSDREEDYGKGDIIGSFLSHQLNNKPLPKDLPLELRKKIFYEACEAENRAIREAKAKYLFSGTLNKEESGNRSEMKMNLMKKYRKEVWGKYNMSEDQGVKIGAEGIENNWPQPPWESPW